MPGSPRIRLIPAGWPLSRMARPGRRQVRPRWRGGAGPHPAHRPAQCTGVAGGERAGPFGHSACSSASGSDLGHQSGHQPAAIGIAGALSASAVDLSGSQAPRRADRTGGGAGAGSSLKLPRARVGALMENSGRRNHPALVDQISRPAGTGAAAPTPRRRRLRSRRDRPHRQVRRVTTGRRHPRNRHGSRVDATRKQSCVPSQG